MSGSYLEFDIMEALRVARERRTALAVFSSTVSNESRRNTISANNYKPTSANVCDRG
jgi:hypothetical protein